VPFAIECDLHVAMNKRDDFPRLVNINEASTLIAVKPSTLRAWVLSRKIPFVRVGRLIRFKRSDLLALIETHSVPMREKRSETT
jgi:excisionase family DNA binding protein